MKKIVALGNSVASVKALEKIRQHNPDVELKLICLDGALPYDRELFPRFIAKELTAKQLSYKPAEFYEKNSIKLIADKVITRINLNRNKIFTEDKEQIDFDVLILSDLPEHRFPEIKGNNKEGIHSFKNLKDIEQIARNLIFVEVIAIQANSFYGLQIATSLAQRGKDVLLVCPGKSFFSSFLNSDVSKLAKQLLEEQKLKIIEENSIVEILGDTDVKAMRLKTGKVLACDMILLEETREDLRIISESALEVNKKIHVNEFFQTNLEHVFAVDNICDKGFNQELIYDVAPLKTLEYQGEIVASKILQTNEIIEPRLNTFVLKAANLSILVLGNIFANNNFSSSSGQIAQGYGKLFTIEGIAVGAILINLDSQQDKISHIIESKIDLKDKEALVFDQNFDFEQIKNFQQQIITETVTQAQPDVAGQLNESSSG